MSKETLTIKGEDPLADHPMFSERPISLEEAKGVVQLADHVKTTEAAVERAHPGFLAAREEAKEEDGKAQKEWDEFGSVPYEDQVRHIEERRAGEQAEAAENRKDPLY